MDLHLLKEMVVLIRQQINIEDKSTGSGKLNDESEPLCRCQDRGRDSKHNATVPFCCIYRRLLMVKCAFFTVLNCRICLQIFIYTFTYLFLWKNNATASYSTLKCAFRVRMSVFVLVCDYAHC